MENKIVNEEELKLLLSQPVNEQEISAPASKPQRLNMKFLYARIKELQEDNRILTERLEALDQQLQGYTSFHTEAVAEKETPLQSDLFADGHIPRSVRHPATQKKSIWTSLFHPSSSGNK